MGKHPGLTTKDIPLYMGPSKPKNSSPSDELDHPTNQVEDIPNKNNATQSPFKKVPTDASALEERNIKVSNLVSLNNMISDAIKNPRTKVTSTIIDGFKRQYQKLLDYQGSKNISDSSYTAELERLRELIDQLENK